jgi:hypothetical protein
MLYFMQIPAFEDNACHPERSEGSLRPSSQILRFAQDDSLDISQVRSRAVFSPNVWHLNNEFDNPNNS